MKDEMQWYRALKARDAKAYNKAIQYAESFALNWNLPLSKAAELERSHVMFACELLGVRPA